MKQVFILLVVLVCYSCNTDDSNTADDNNQQSNVLSKIITTSYYLGEPEIINTISYSANKPIADSTYSVSNDIWIYIDYTYEDDKLVRREAYTQGSSQIDEYIIHYDDLGRIIETSNTTSLNSSTTMFTYDNETISSVNDTNGNLSSKVFYLNPDGIIFKEVSTEETIELIYDDDYNVISYLSSSMGTTNYTYDTNNLPPPNTQLFQDFMFGDYKNNNALFENNIGGIGFSYISNTPKYHLSTINDDNTSTFVWTLNTDGYPTKRQTFDTNNVLISTFDYVYE